MDLTAKKSSKRNYLKIKLGVVPHFFRLSSGLRKLSLSNGFNSDHGELSPSFSFLFKAWILGLR
jgi:hypothetical protein